MTLPNEVKFKVRAIALDLGSFTVAEVTRVTALNTTSIRTELQRMKRQGFLTSEPDRADKRGRGAPPHRYKLTDDPEKRLDLVYSIEPFYNQLPSFDSRPSSLHYQAAATLTERLETMALSGVQRKAVLQDIDRHLALAAEEEGIDIRPEAETAVAAAHLDLLRARLSLAVGQWEQVGHCLVGARQTFASNGMPEMVEQAEALQTALAVEQTLAQALPDSTMLDRLQTALQKASGALPVSTVRRMVDAMQNLIASTLPSGVVGQKLPPTAYSVVGEDNLRHKISEYPVQLSRSDETDGVPEKSSTNHVHLATLHDVMDHFKKSDLESTWFFVDADYQTPPGEEKRAIALFEPSLAARDLIKRVVGDKEFYELFSSDPDKAFTGYNLTSEEMVILRNLDPDDLAGFGPTVGD